MARRAATSGRIESNFLFPLLVVLGIVVSAALPLPGLSPGPGAAGPAPVAPGHSLGAVAAAQLRSAQASLGLPAGASVAPRPGAAASNWSLVPGNNSSAIPSPRQLESMAYDPTDGYVVMFGGGNVNPTGQTNDTWTFSNGTWSQLNVTPSPGVRRSAAMVWDAADGYILMFGGLNPGPDLGSSVRYQDTWSFLHGVWTNLTPASINANNTPSYRWNAQMAYDPGLGETILFGGCFELACAASTNDTWAYAAGVWVNLSASAGPAPSVRGTATLTWYPTDQALVLFGGSTPAQTVLGDTWELVAGGWTQLAPATSPSARGDAWMVYDSSHANLVLFGGWSYTVSPSGFAQSDTWTYSNGTWTNRTLNNSPAPSARWGLQESGAFNATGGCAYLFGGSDSNNNNFGDTWEYGCVAGGNSSGSGGSGGSGGGGGGGGPPQLLLGVTPSVGTAPLRWTANATLSGLQGPGNFSLSLDAYLGSSTNPTWSDLWSSWNGSSLTTSGVFNASGTYLLVGVVNVDQNGTWTYLASANQSVLVQPGSANPPSVTLTVAPSSGSAPLNVTLSVVASGGSSPYDLAVCAEGPMALPNATGPCTSVGSTSGWNGTAWPLLLALDQVGNYTVLAMVSDNAGGTSTASAGVVVLAPTPLAPLVVHASYVAPSGVTADGATYGFLTVVSGGQGPYGIQWSFGDGASGSALAQGYARHTYTTSGSYTATLTVTDALGHRAVATVGPLVVALKVAPGAASSFWSSGVVAVGAAALALASALVIGLTVLRLSRRREALNWLREMEHRGATKGTETGPR